MTQPSTIAIDGPAASGKSTLGLKLAQWLNYLFFDTGVMYRAITWMVMEYGISPDDEAAVTALAERADLDLRPASQADGRSSDILADGKDITWEIRHPQVEANVSQISAYPGVRSALTQHQRRIGLRGQVVMVGRDIGTVVMPGADLKIYLDASAEERARRRCREVQARGEQIDYERVLSAMRERDRIDSTRAVAPLRPADDAVILDADRLDAGQVLDKVKEMIENF
jgi:CMP/dCMP kinase